MQISTETELRKVLDIVISEGASYADVRIVRRQWESLIVRNDELERNTESESEGFGVRVLYDGAWGFACSFEQTPEEFLRVADEALRIARGASRRAGEKVKLASQDSVKGEWRSPFKRDPFQVSKEEKLELLFASAKAMRIPSIRVAKATLDFFKEHKTFASSEGSFVRQELIISGGGLEAVAVEGEDNQVRSYPISFGGNFRQAGYEYIESIQLIEHAPEVAQEAVALLSAKQCPSGEKTIILDSSQMGLQIHESCGHPTELDRALGMEAGFAGGSFLSPDKLGKFQYGSENVTIAADAACPGGVGTFGYDDEGVPGQQTRLIDRGNFVGYLSSRETAEQLQSASNGTVRADGWNYIPLIRMTNINLEPGTWSLEEMIKETRDGLFLKTTRSWSIDDQRLNFQFGTEAAYEIKDGSLGDMVKNATYTGITPDFWNRCDAVAGEKFWELWGLPNCGKGEPIQEMFVGHGASPARFSKVRVGVGKW